MLARNNLVIIRKPLEIFLRIHKAAKVTVQPAFSPFIASEDLHPGAVGQHARLLYAACKAMPNVVERRDFRWDR
jgi:hypothetical protein